MSAAAKHTPGPWVVNPRNAIVDAMPSGVAVCKLLWPTKERSEAETMANATLIAAAPELLAELRKARDRLASAMRIGGSSPEYIAEAVASHDAAIAKATGAQP